MRRKLAALLLIPLLASCAQIQSAIAGGSGGYHCNPDKTTCSASFNYSQAPRSSLPPASIPGVEPQPAPAVTQTVYVIVQSCLPDPTSEQLTSLASSIPACLQIPEGQQQFFFTLVVNVLNQTPQEQFASQQGRDDWRDQELAGIVQQCDQRAAQA